MPVSFKIIPRLSLKSSAWQGGSTTELAVYPPGSSYAKRDFSVRVSAASVNAERSEFTSLPGFTRLITPLNGVMRLTHNGRDRIELAPFEPHRFDGGWLTVSEGICDDFNLMLGPGWDGKIGAVLSGARLVLEPGRLLWVYCLKPFTALLPGQAGEYALEPGGALFASSPGSSPGDAVTICISAGNGGAVCAVMAKAFAI